MSGLKNFLANALTIALMLGFSIAASAFPSGSPVCTITTETMNGAMGQRSGVNPGNWTLTATTPTYAPGGSAFIVTVSNTANQAHKGLLIWVTDSAGNQVGKWTDPGAASGYQRFCNDQSITHQTNAAKSTPRNFSITLPITVRGQITVRLFVVQANAADHYELVSTHVHLDPVRDDLDIDSSVSQSRYQATTDGMLVLRYLIGVTGSSLTSGVKSMSAIRTDAEITTQLNYLRTNGFLDVDGDGQTRPETDGLLILRYLLGYRQDALVAGVNAGNLSATQIEAKITALLP